MPDTPSWEPHAPPSGGGVTSVTATPPLASSGGTTPNLSVAPDAASRFLATPAGAAGAVSLRSIAAEDLPATGVTPGSYTNGNFSVGADGRLTAASNGSAGGVSWTDSFFSPVTLAQTQLSGGLGGGSYTAGVLFYLTRAATIGKIRFLWPTSAAATVRVRIWTGGTSVATTTVAVSTAGAYEGTVNYAVGSADLYRSFYATTFIVGLASYISYNPGGSIVLANSPPLGGPSLVYSHLGFFAIGDAQPTNSTGGELFPVEPILQ